MNPIIPGEATQALAALEDAVGSSVGGVYLYGSAVAGGLRNRSDVDILAVVTHEMTDIARTRLADSLLRISGKIGNRDSVRPLEVTVVNRADVAPWRYPPRKAFIYGEWLRKEFEQGQIPKPAGDPDLAILLSQIRQSSVALAGCSAAEAFDPVPLSDLRRAMLDCLPSLIACTRGDERNVLLTLARMWVTAVTGEFLPKDEAARWALPRLPKEQADLLQICAAAYRGELEDHWDGLDADVDRLAGHMREIIQRHLSIDYRAENLPDMTYTKV